jgi:iron complex outermembrane recepter protein
VTLTPTFKNARPLRARVVRARWLCAALRAHPVLAQEAVVTPPQVVTRIDALYPSDALQARQEGTSTLLVTIEPDGAVGAVEVAESAGAALDEAAIMAVRQWRFRPATRADEPVRARIRVPVRFVLPAVEVPAELAPSAPSTPPTPLPTPAAPAPTTPSPTPPETAIDVTVRGERMLRTEDRSASDFTVARAVLEAAPRQDGAEMLRTVPGLYIARAEGLAVGHRYMLRGFDADHGQDIEFRVGGIPINLPSHIHGQGYADLGFLIAESVDALHVSEGVYDPRQGDFAVAGSIEARLGVQRRGWQVRSSYGAFNAFRQLLLWAPPGQDRGTFGAVQYSRTDGFGPNRQGQAVSAIVQTVFGEGAWRYRVLGILYGARSDLAGVVRADDVEAGRVGFYDVYPYATARGQNALAGRILTGAWAEYRGSSGDNADMGVWLGWDDFRLQENFTGFIQRSQRARMQS